MESSMTCGEDAIIPASPRVEVSENKLVNCMHDMAIEIRQARRVQFHTYSTQELTLIIVYLKQLC